MGRGTNPRISLGRPVHANTILTGRQPKDQRGFQAVFRLKRKDCGLQIGFEPRFGLGWFKKVEAAFYPCDDERVPVLAR